ncbi:MAG: dephospho-CoA kinase [Paracoccaceae bacterium]|nr:dephospho-CoA kinase [Paracoccaceae bacterium]MDG1738423.1 dephospho-CoA kinase [Paracoccaceae bacterium]MDG2259830.1 dephospho-CoA kinase [Paracoccaceae bacterium]
MTFVIGLTGSIGMGKTTTATLFRHAGCAVWDADASVHRLYSKGGAAVDPIRAAFPNAITNCAVDRAKLKDVISQDPTALERIESMVHPLVAADRAAFLVAHDGQIVVLDMPLLFETGADANMDATIVVSVDAKTQRQRVLERGTMTESQFETILAKQMPDAEKRAKADFIVITDTPEHAGEQVKTILNEIRGKNHA